MCHLYLSILGIFSLAQCFAADCGLRHLDKATELAQAITNEDVRVAVISELEACKNCLLQEEKNIMEYIRSLYENLDEIMAESEEDELKLEITARIEKAAGQLEE